MLKYMSMSMCDRCLENNWNYEFIDGWIRATCNFCGHEVEFETKKAEKQRANSYNGEILSI